MNTLYINFYNNLVKLTRNKELYKFLDRKDIFSDRLTFLLLHFSFFLKIYKKSEKKPILQNIFDSFFKQLELNIREIGYGDQTVNKKMKDYINFFYSLLDKIDNWETISKSQKNTYLSHILNTEGNLSYLIDYFEKYRVKLTNNTLTFYLKGVDKQ
jgi:cytochrome b pre-mRNA-processing protein 3